LRGVNADRKATRAGIDIVARQRALMDGVVPSAIRRRTSRFSSL
jgi:hypothetical protein